MSFRHHAGLFSYAKENKVLRYGFFAIFAIALIIGFAPLTTLFAPYSAYGRIVNSLFKPLYDLLNNWLASMDAANDRYNFTEVQIWTRSVTTFVVAILTLLILAFLAWRKGRAYCNSICPVGTFLSFFSRFSLLRVRFDKDKCKSCGMCEKNCKQKGLLLRRSPLIRNAAHFSLAQPWPALRRLWPKPR